MSALFFFAATAHGAAPLCDQSALDERAAAANARYADLNLLDLMKTTHTLSEEKSVTYEGRTLAVGAKVGTIGQPGTVKPSDTGHSAELVIAGHTGTVQCFTDSVSGTFPNQLAVVRWDPGEWRTNVSPTDAMKEGKTYTRGEVQTLIREQEAAAPMVELEAFESTIHPSYLRAVTR